VYLGQRDESRQIGEQEGLFLIAGQSGAKFHGSRVLSRQRAQRGRVPTQCRYWRKR
jgi:hypothetical protein